MLRNTAGANRSHFARSTWTPPGRNTRIRGWMHPPLGGWLLALAVAAAVPPGGRAVTTAPTPAPAPAHPIMAATQPHAAVPVDPDLARRFHDHVAYLASDRLEGRGTGTKGNDLAAEYIAAQFERAGLQPAGPDGTYFQPFEVTLAQKLTGQPALTFTGAPVTAILHTHFVPLPFSSSESFNAPVAFAGYGITNEEAGYDDYAGFDAKGKVLLILRYEPHDQDPKAAFGGQSPSQFASFQSKARTAREHGAAALLIVNPPLHHGEQDKLFAFDSVDDGQNFDIPMMHISRDLAAGLLRAAGAPDLSALQTELDTHRKPRSFDLKGIRARGTPGVVREKATTRNVIGLLPGSGPLADEYVVIGAHYDHLGVAVPRGAHSASRPEGGRPEIHNGADDNASGTAGLMVLAEMFAAGARNASEGFGERTNVRRGDPAASKSARKRQIREKTSGNKRSLLFIAFSGEEMGLLGSMYFVNHPTIPLDHIAAMLNMDMIGRVREHRLQVFGIKTSPMFETLVSGFAQRFGFKLETSAGGFGPSDHTAFYGRKIPVMHFFTGIHNDYHRPTDDTERINAEGAARVVEMIAAIAADVREAPERPQYVAIAESRPSRAGLKVRMGVMPSYAEDEQPGLQLDGVSPGSPAEKAGLQSGDRLLMIGDTSINNVYDLMDAMAKYEPGNEANLTVLRAGQRIQMAVKFEAP